MNRVKDILREGGAVIGVAAFPSDDVAFLAGSGFDFLLFDTQHAPVEIKELGPCIRSMRGVEGVPIVRVGENGADQICYALDQGAKGIVVPMVNSAKEAEDMVRWCKYPFDGVRSSAGMSGDWGDFASYREYMDAVNEQLLVVPMIETVEALDAIEEILAVKGIDVLLIGPSDLSINLDVALDYTNSKYQDALDRIAEASINAGVVPGLYFVPPGLEPKELIERGFRFFTLPWRGWAREGISNGIKNIV